jgi:pimeloyl-ACP methyl ester carboxylesterase
MEFTVSGMAERPVVLLHGCGGSREATFDATGWTSALAAAGRRAIALHLPGHGAHSASREPASYADLAGLVMQQLPSGAFDAVGFSLGAKLLLEIAIRAPDRIGRMVLGGIGDNVFAPESIGDAAAHALENGLTPDTPAPVRRFLETFEPERNDALAIAAVLRRPPNPAFTEERLRGIRTPVLIVNGTDDPVASLGQRLISSLGNVATITLPDVDHLGLPAQAAFLAHGIDFLTTDAIGSLAGAGAQRSRG